MSNITIPGLGDYDSDGVSPSPELTLPDYYMAVDCIDFCVKLVDKKTRTDDSIILLDKLTDEQVYTLGVRLKDNEVDQEEDDYIHCEKCDAYYRPVCKDHPLYWVKDREVRGENVDRAQKSVPAFIRIKVSSIPHAGMGAFATTHIPTGIVFGPYQGLLINDVKLAQEDGYSWEITNKQGTIFIDGSNTQYSNWMRYINSSRHDKEQNLLAFQYNGAVYYRVIRTIMKNDELLVWYGKKFGETLGVFTTRPSNKRSTGKNPFIL